MCVIQMFVPRQFETLFASVRTKSHADGRNFGLYFSLFPLILITLVLEAFKSDGDIQDGKRIVSLLDVVSRNRIVTPARTTFCQHITVFDLSNWIRTRFTTVTCPLCNVPCTLADVFIDEYFTDILKQVDGKGTTT